MRWLHSGRLPSGRVRRQLEGQTVIESGVAAGERVVTEGQLRLAPGTKVDIKGAKPS